jgi:hypothetical protein
MADLEHARSMLRMARKDFNALVGMRGNPLFADEIFGFHVQQAVEKALKAWLCVRDVAFLYRLIEPVELYVKEYGNFRAVDFDGLLVV